MMNVEVLRSNPNLAGNGSVTPDGFLEIIPDRLLWVSASQIPRNSQTHHFFSIDNELVYEPFFADFGPLNLACTYRYCKLVEAILNDAQLANKKIVHFCSQCPKKRANAAYLICCFQVMILGRSSEAAYRPFAQIRPPFLPFRDATSGICTYQCTVLDCVQGLEYAMRIKWFHPDRFDVVTYEYYEKVEHGDMNWVIPDKFLAFTGPSASPIDAYGYPCFTPEDYVPIFKSGGVTTVVRLNKKQYDRKRFTEAGLKHVDLYFLDGSCPSREIIDKFLQISEQEPGALAVHCKAGLGRTGTLIGLYAQKHYQFPGRAYIGWNRICRPGAILGPQQQFLSEMQHEMFQLGAVHRANLTGQTLALQNISDVRQRQQTAEEMREDVGQGDRLTAAKREGALNAFNSNNFSTSGRLPSGLGGNGGKFLQGRPSGAAKPLRGMFGQQPQPLI